MNGNDPNFLKWFLEKSDKEKARWIIDNRPVHVFGVGSLLDACRYCTHWNRMCGEDKGQACIGYANFHFAYKSERAHIAQHVKVSH